MAQASQNRETKMVQCMHCKFATYKQWFKNPIISICQKTGEKFVAESRRLCDRFVERTTTPEIEHFDHY